MRDKINASLLLCVPLLFFIIGIGLPVNALFIKALTNIEGQYIGIKNFQAFFANPYLCTALINSLGVSLVVGAISTFLAFIIALTITHSVFKKRHLIFSLIQMPLFVPSIFPCLGLIYLLGSQGILTPYLPSFELYGPIGVIMGGVIFTLPHATLILVTALSSIDHQYYQVANTLGVSSFRQFFTITLSHSSYSIMSTFGVVFTLAMTDFGIAKILSGQYPLLATEIYKQVIGQQNFSMGATLSFVLIVPTLFSLAIDSWARKKQMHTTYKIMDNSMIFSSITNKILLCLCSFIILIVLSVIGVVVWGSLISYWPYDFSITFTHYDFAEFGYGWQPYINSLKLALLVASLGSILVFLSSYLTTRCRIFLPLTFCFRFLAFLPLSIPGTVLGLAYLFAFNTENSLFSSLYGTLGILFLNTTIHLFSVSYMTSTIGLKSLNPRYESISDSMGVPRWRTILKVILPLSTITLSNIFVYLFVNSLTTVSAVIFLYGPKTQLASIAILNMDDNGALSAASAMGTLLLLTALFVKTLQRLFLHVLTKSKLSNPI